MSLGRVVHEIERGNWGAFIDNDAVLKAYLGGARADAH
jgi:hypothetical protein